MQLDPGFRLYLQEEISKSSQIQRQILRTTIKFLEDFKILLNNKLAHKNEKEISDYLINIIDKDPNTYNAREIISFSRISLNNKKDKVIGFLFPTWLNLMKAGEHKKASAIESICLELKTQYFNGTNPFLIENIPIHNQTYGLYFKMLKEFFKYINFFMFDYLEANTHALNYTQDNYLLLSWWNNPEFDKFLDDIILHFSDLFGKKILKESYERVNEIIEMILLIFLNQLSKIQKYELLNRFFGINYVLLVIELTPFEQIQRFVLENEWFLFENGIFDHFSKYLPKDYFSLNEKDDRLFQKYILIYEYFPEKISKFLKGNIIETYSFIELKKKIKSKNISICTVMQWIVINLIQEKLLSTNQKKDLILNLLGWIAHEYNNRSKFRKRFGFLTLLINRINGNYVEERIFIEGLLSKEYKEKLVSQQDFMELFDFYQKIHRIELYHKNLSLEYCINQSFYSFNNEFMEDIYVSKRYLELEKHKLYSSFSIKEEFFHQKIKQLSKAGTLQDFSNNVQKLNKISSYIMQYGGQEQYYYYETIIFSHFYLKNFIDIVNLLKKYKENNIPHIYLEEYKFLVKIMLDQTQDIITDLLEYFQKGKMELHNSNEKYHAYFDDMLFKIYLSKKEDQFYEFIDYLIKSDGYKAMPDSEKAEFVFTLGNSLADRGLSEDSLKFYKLCEKYTNDRKLIAESYSGNGAALLEMGNIIEAKNYFKKAIEKYPKSIYFFNLSRCYSNFHDYFSAIDVLKEGIGKLKNEDENKELLVIEEELEKCEDKKSSIINLNTIQNDEALAHLKSASRLISISEKLVEFSDNIGFIFTEIANGIDCLMQEKFNPLILLFISENCPEDKLSKEKYKSLPRVVINIKSGKSASLGEWERLFKDMREVQKNESIIKVRSLFPNSLTNEILSELENELSILTTTRNPASHGGVIKKEEFLNRIRPYINAGNHIIHFINIM